MSSTSDQSAILVVGAGKAGIIAGLAATLRYPGRKVVFVDPAEFAGGSFASFQAEPGVQFDRGVHLIPHVEVPLFNDFFKAENGFDEDFWNRLSYPRRDRHGKIFNGKVHNATSLPDVATFEEALRQQVLAEFNALQSVPLTECKSAGEYLIRNFGSTFASAITPYVEALFGVTADKLSPSVLVFLPLSRLVIAGADDTALLMQDANLQNRIGFPDQENIPKNLRPTKVNYYPKRSGIGAFIDLMIKYIDRRGGQFRLGQKVESFAVNEQGEIIACRILGDTGEEDINCNHVIWTAPLFFLKGPIANSDMDAVYLPPTQPPARRLQFVHFTTKEPIFDTSAFYFYDLDPNRRFRITNYSAYTEHPAGHAYTMEYIVPFRGTGLDKETSVEDIFKFLAEIGRAHIDIDEVWVDPIAIPVPNFEIFTGEANVKRERGPSVASNFYLFGPSSNQGFYLSRDLYEEAAQLMEEMI